MEIIFFCNKLLWFLAIKEGFFSFIFFHCIKQIMRRNEHENKIKTTNENENIMRQNISFKMVIN